jgi:hypothetical protein
VTWFLWLSIGFASGSIYGSLLTQRLIWRRVHAKAGEQ